ncbi:3587_t:CDS:2, partial [Funneliformis geosporum]
MAHKFKINQKVQYRTDPQNNDQTTRHGVIKEHKPNLKYIVETEGKER